MSVELSNTFQSSAAFDYTQPSPVFDMAEPDVTVELDPSMLLHEVENATLMCDVQIQAAGDSFAGLFSAGCKLVDDVSGVTAQLEEMNAKQAAVQSPQQSVLDTSLTQAETKFTVQAQKFDAPALA